jgi:hypothetical protein
MRVLVENNSGCAGVPLQNAWNWTYRLLSNGTPFGFYVFTESGFPPDTFSLWIGKKEERQRWGVGPWDACAVTRAGTRVEQSRRRIAAFYPQGNLSVLIVKWYYLMHLISKMIVLGYSLFEKALASHADDAGGTGVPPNPASHPAIGD